MLVKSSDQVIYTLDIIVIKFSVFLLLTEKNVSGSSFSTMKEADIDNLVQEFASREILKSVLHEVKNMWL